MALRFASLLFFAAFAGFLVAHPVCRSCNKSCYQNTTSVNGTEVDDLLAELQNHERPKRSTAEGEVEFRACSRFQIEMLLIPLSIAMIPIVLTALILCTCCCGPKESRGKLPEDFLATLPMSKKRRISSEELELEFRDGYVQRKDSSKTKFSTVVSYIEARRESIWSTRTDPESGDVAARIPSVPMESPAAAHDTLRSTPSGESVKKTRFSDTVSVISLDSLPRR